MTAVSFTVPKDVTLKIAEILKRCEVAGITKKADRLHHHMNLSATHANGCQLDFDKLATFDSFNLSHDINGIDRHMNRDTGTLGGCFVPRCAVQ